MYSKQLPSRDKIARLAQLGGPYPTTARHLLIYAKTYNLGNEVVGFLDQFLPEEKFSSSDDFITRYDDLKFLINEERQAPFEFLRSKQD